MNWSKLYYSHRRKPKDYLFENMPHGEISTSKKMIFCTGMGRSGTHFFAELFDQSNNVNAYHLDEVGNSVADSFFQYAKWYNIDIDITPLINSRSYLAKLSGNIYFESNPYLSLHVPELLENFESKVIILYRNPKNVLESHFNKGWYSNYEPTFNMSKGKVPGYQYNIEKGQHFFGRFIPKEKCDLENWLNYSTIGKIGWNWSMVYTEILKSLESTKKARIVRTDSFNYDQYLHLCEFLEVNPIQENVFLATISKKPGKAIYKKKPSWNNQELLELDMLTKPVFDLLETNANRIK